MAPVGVQTGCPTLQSGGRPVTGCTPCPEPWPPTSSTNTAGGRFPTLSSPQSSAHSPTPRQVRGAALSFATSEPAPVLPQAGVFAAGGACNDTHVGIGLDRTQRCSRDAQL